MSDDRIQMTDSPSHDFSPGSDEPKLPVNPVSAAENFQVSPADPAAAAENFYSSKTTRAYKCGKCCASCCCTTKYTCCGGKDSKCGCTPYTTAEGLGMGSALAGAGSGFATTCVLMCNTCCGPPCPCTTAKVCGDVSGLATMGIVSGGFFGVALLFGCQALTTCICDKYCGKLTMKLGCPNFSRGFDERDE